MEKQLRGYIFRMYPTKEQQVLIEKSFGTSRYIYNHFLEESIKLGKMNAYELIKKIPELTKENIWLKEVDSCLLRSSIFDLDKAYQKRDKEEKGLPKFKSKNKSRKSYRTNTYKNKKYESIKLDLERKTITLPKLKEVKVRGYRKLNKINGRIINVTVYKEADKYYVSVCAKEVVIAPAIIPSSIVGIDVGIKNLAITSDGKIYNNLK